MKIRVVGPGCKNCHTLYELAKEAVLELELNAEVEHITDVAKMISLGVSKSPGLMIDEKVISQGKKLKKNEVISLIKQYQS